ncbi:MAG: hypothetical protein ABIP75_08055 [Pyrinomonadaceae bacterium]
MSIAAVEAVTRKLDEQIMSGSAISSATVAKWHERQRTLGLLHGDRPICPYLRPFFLSRSQYTEISQAARLVHSAFERMTEAALADEGLLAELDLTEAESRMARIDPGYSDLCVTSRLDSFVTTDGFKFLEYNAESPAGLGDQLSLEQFLFAMGHNREFLGEHEHWLPRPAQKLLDALVAAYRDWGGKEAKPQIAIVDWNGVSTASEFVILQEIFNTAGYPTIICDPHELEYDGTSLSARGFCIDIFYKRVIIHEFLEKFDDRHPLIRAYQDHRICLANSFRVKIAHKKSGFAILSDPKYRHLFLPDQQAAIDQHIPWTRQVREMKTDRDGQECDLIEYTRANRDRLALKPNDDYGGAGIYLGWTMDETAWDGALTDALSKTYVVQERAAARKIAIPSFSPELGLAHVFVDFDPFLFLGQVEGGLVRLSPSALINVSQGGGETALVVLEGI